MTRRVVVFDVGGVIVRWQPLALMRHHLPMAEPQEAFTNVFQHWAPGSDWLAFDLGHIRSEALAERISRRTGYPVAALASLIGGIPAHLAPMPSSVALMDRVHSAGHRLAVLSNMPAPYADHLESAHACFGAFEHRVWSGRIGLAKPEPAIFAHLQNTLDAEPNDIIFLDDVAGNVEAARRCGWQALHFQSAELALGELTAAGWLP